MKRPIALLSFLLLLAAFFSPRLCFAQAVLRAGDTVEIRLSGVPAEEIGVFSTTQAIDDGGMINLSYIGKIKVIGMDCSVVQQMIESKLKEDKIYTNPTVTVTPQSGTRLVNVTGEVKSSGRLSYTADMTVMNAIGGAGGFNDFADKKRVKLTRNGKVQEIDATKFIKDPSKDVKVLPGDQIFVPQAGIFSW
ncbi:MAG: polysaccharide biosynthesis/export family protein [Verrucomicrobiota bacterium]